jgi:pilus assembly protein CpaE
MSSLQTTEKIRVLIVDDIPETRDNLRKLIQFEPDIEVVAQASTGEEGVEMARSSRPDVVLMDINMPGLDGISACEIITRDVPTAQVVIMSVQRESDYIRRAMLARAMDFLTKPFSGDELIATVRQAYDRGKALRASMPSGQPAGPGAPAVSMGKPRSEGKTIVVFSPKGGTGCSVIAANLGVALAQAGKKTALVDANLAFGDCGVLLDVHAMHSIVDLAQRSDELDVDLVSSAVAAHNSGLKVLLSSPRPEMSELVSADHLTKILSLFRLRYDYTIVDTFTSLQDVMLATLDQADKILLVATPDIPCIKDVRLFFEVIEQLEYERSAIMLVLNQVDRHSGISPDDVEKTLKHRVEGVIPTDQRTVMYSVNQGIPFVMRESGRPVSVAVVKLAERLREMLEEKDEELVSEDTADSGRTRLGRLFGNR